MATPKKLPSGNWRIFVYVGKDAAGKRVYKSFTDPDKRKVQRVAAQFLDEQREIIAAGTVRHAVESYIISREKVLSPSTVRSYRAMQNALERDTKTFMGTSVDKVDQRTMQTWVNSMTETGVSGKTIKNRHALVVSSLSCVGKKVPDVQLPTSTKHEAHILDVEDVQRLIKCAEGSEMEIPVLLAAFGGLRRSEIVALTLDDVDETTVHVHKATVLDSDLKPVTKPTTKTQKSTRTVPLPPFVIQKIMDAGCITSITNPERISERFSHIARRAGCPGTRFHDLRHFYASYLHSIGVPEADILSRGGWEHNGVMETVYRHSLNSSSNVWNQTINTKFTEIWRDAFS